MKAYTVAIQVIAVYSVEVEAESESQALAKAQAMTVADIAERGALKSIGTDFAEIV